MKKGFTLIELLVVIAIIAILVTISLVSFRTSQMRSRDAERKSDLKQISSALELYYSDYGKYPSDSAGKIEGCPATTNIACSWGSDEFRDTDSSGNTKTTYFKVLPKDPAGGLNYVYRIVPSSSNQKYQLFAHLENSQDLNLIATPYTCGGSTPCNFAVTSSNTTPSE